MTKYTPGPWTIYTHDGALRDGETLLAIGHEGESALNQYEDVAYINPTVALNEGTERAGANARLLAAAPDLLEALRALMLCTTKRARDDAEEMSKCAIAKAEGRE